MISKMKWTFFIMMILVLAFGPINAIGQEVPAGKWWKIPRVASELSLTEVEIKRLDDLFIQNRRDLIDLKAVLERARFDLDLLLEQEPFEESVVMEQYKKLERAQSDLSFARFKFLIDVRKILGLKRYEHIKKLFKELREKKIERKKEKDG